MKSNPEKAEKYSINEVEPLIKSILDRYNELTEEQLCLNLKYNGGYISQLRSREKSTGEPQVSLKFYNQLKSFRLQNANYEYREKPSMVNEDPALYKVEGTIYSGKDMFIALLEEKDRVIKKMESYYEDAKNEKTRLLNHNDKLADILDKTLKEISENLKTAAISLTQSNQQIALIKDQTYIVSDQLEHQRQALNLGFPGQPKTQPVPFVKKGKGAAGLQQDVGKKHKGH